MVYFYPRAGVGKMIRGQAGDMVTKLLIKALL